MSGVVFPSVLFQEEEEEPAPFEQTGGENVSGVKRKTKRSVKKKKRKIKPCSTLCCSLTSSGQLNTSAPVNSP